METIKEMRERHKREIKHLQETCKHPKALLSDWMQYHWAIGHYAGYDVRTCGICGKIIKKRGWDD